MQPLRRRWHGAIIVRMPLPPNDTPSSRRPRSPEVLAWAGVQASRLYLRETCRRWRRRHAQMRWSWMPGNWCPLGCPCIPCRRRRA